MVDRTVIPDPRRRWSTLTRVEHVTLYTRWSLLLGLWGANSAVLLTAVAEPVSVLGGALLLIGGFGLTILGSHILGVLLERDPATGPWPRRRIAALGLCGLLFTGIVSAVDAPDEVRGGAALATVIAWTLSLGVLPRTRDGVLLVAASTALLGVVSGQLDSAAAGAFLATLFVVTGRASMWLLGIVRELDTSRQAQSDLAVAEERLRFSRDVHDVLGRRLSTIAVQAELAATLAARGDERAPERMLEVREVAHQALREARELARGYRQTNFAQELEGARSLLRAAGIEVRLEVDAMPQAWHEAAGLVVREGVTNVLRHSHATVVEITYADGLLRLHNDGARPSGGDAAGTQAHADEDDPSLDGPGTGLRSLRERLTPLGVSLDAAPDGEAGWTVVAEFPETGPLSARSAGSVPRSLEP